MEISTELQRLLDMRAAGHLSEAEFEAAKARLLGPAAPPTSAPPAYPPPASPPANWGAATSSAPPPPPVPDARWGGSGQNEAWAPGPARHAQSTDAYESPYYQRQFAGFDGNGGRFAATWNWAAFLFGGFWYLVRGMWAKALLILVITFVTGGFLTIPLWLYAGIAGNYDYYLLRRKRTQLWS